LDRFKRVFGFDDGRDHDDGRELGPQNEEAAVRTHSYFAARQHINQHEL
jgi:hypothetical protein